MKVVERARDMSYAHVSAGVKQKPDNSITIPVFLKPGGGYWQVGAKLQMSGKGPDRSPEPSMVHLLKPPSQSKISSGISGSLVS